MMQIKNYQILGTIDIRAMDSLYRVQQSDQKTYLLLASNTNDSDLNHLSRLEHELNISKHLRISGILKALRLEKDPPQPLLILEDFEGEILKQQIISSRLDLSDFFKLSLQLIRILGELHQEGVIHKDLKPANILVHKENQQVKLYNFTMASPLSQNKQELKPAGRFEGTQAYSSPEQTGQMNRVIDWRTDYYALGVTFYEMLTGQLPFQTEDPLELFHCHMTQLPIPPQQIKAEIPELLGEIVLKLMSKNPEERYQSAYGLFQDLKECQKQWKTHGAIFPFPLGQSDLSEQFRIPTKLYGRQKEVAYLQQVFAKVIQGESALFFISGQAGVGKSVLVQTLTPVIETSGSYFIKGKCEQFQQNIPYGALIHAFQQLVHQLLTQSNEKLVIWKNKLQQALDINGKILIDLVPELEQIIGVQPAIQKLNPLEEQNRFLITLRQFIKVFAQATHPLVIFLDDLQWSDLPSLKLIENLIRTEKILFFFLIGAYRNQGHPPQELHERNHPKNSPLFLALNEIEKVSLISNTPFHSLELSPLTQGTIHQILTDSLECKPERCQSLAKLVFDKTHGNPFFINNLLMSLHQAGHFFFQSNQGCWNWELDKIQQMDISENVIEWMLTHIRKLPASTQTVLRVAACLGHQFDLKTLSIVHQQSIAQIYQSLWPALQQNLILSLQDEETGILDQPYVEEISSLTKTTFRFQHDRIQQATYQLIEEGQRSMLHLTIGRLLLQKLNEVEQEGKLIDIVHHFNEGREAIEDPQERNRLAELNLRSEKKIRESIAYRSALEYLTIAQELLPEAAWIVCYPLTFEIHQNLMEAAYLSGEFEIAETTGQLLIEKAKTTLEKTAIYRMQAIQYTIANKLKEAIQAGSQALSLLGIQLDKKPGIVTVYKEFLSVKWYLWKQKGKEPPSEHLTNIPILSNPEKQMIIKILVELIGPTYMLGIQRFFAIIILKAVHFSLRFGNSPEAAFAYLGYAVILNQMGNFKSADQFGQLALRLNEKFGDLEYRCKILFSYPMFIHIWKHHWKTAIPTLREAVEVGLQTGDLVYAEYAFHSLISFNHTLNLKESIEEIKQYSLLKIANIQKQYRLNLSGKIKNQEGGLTTSLSDNSYDEDENLKKMIKRKLPSSLAGYYVIKLQICFVYEEYQECLMMIKEGNKVIRTLRGLPYVVEYGFYSFMTFAALYLQTPKNEQKHMWKQMQKEYKKMKKWSDHCPDNFLYFRLLMDAEWAKLKNTPLLAIPFYNQAITDAKKNKYLYYEALANEQLAKFYIAQSQEGKAHLSMQEALSCYGKWGAQAKVEFLQERYQALLLLNPNETNKRWGVQEPDPIVVSVHQSTNSNKSPVPIDFHAVIKATQALSKEVELERLLTQLIQIVRESAGADKAILFLPEEEISHLKIQAESIGDQPIRVMQSQDFAGSSHLATSIVHYVLRTQKMIVFDHTSRGNLFTQDAYLQKKKPQSILCLPLLKQQKWVGLLYLENHHLAQAFTANHLEILEILAAQAAISIENLLLWKEKEKAQTKALRQQKQAIDSLKQADKMKDEFLANISHELRTPLHGILGIAQTLIDDSNDSILAIVKKPVQTIIRSGQRLAYLISDILDFSTLKHHGIELDVHSLNIWDGVEVVLGLSQSLIGRKALTLTNAVSKTLPPVLADENRLQQILHNLVDNAIKFTLQGTIEVSACVSGEMLRISVSDTGIGIPTDKQQVIFESFEQVDRSTTRPYGGVGLGLAITQHLVDLHKGSIEVESQEGEGTTFSFTLPLAPEGEGSTSSRLVAPLSLKFDQQAPFDSSTQSMDVPEGHFQILAVDDDPVNLHLLGYQLAQETYNIAYASNGQEALEWLEQHGKPDLMLLDVMMPDLNGFQVCQRIRKQYPLYELPIIFLSARGDEKAWLEGTSVGGNDYLTKPFQHDALKARIRSQLHLTLAKQRMVRLQQLSHQMNIHQDIQKKVKIVFKALCDNKSITHTALFHKGLLVLSYPEETELLQANFLQWKETENFVEETKQPFSFHLSQQAGRHFCFLPLQGIADHMIGLQSQLTFTDIDLEYLKYVISQIPLTLQNNLSLPPESVPPTELQEIISQLYRITFIQSSGNYCLIHKEDSLAPPSMLRTTLKKIKHHVGGDILLQAHRSYLVHSHKVTKLNKTEKNNFELLVGPHRIPVARQYLSKIKKLYHPRRSSF